MKKEIKTTVFKRGDDVQWTSQANGSEKKKRGVVAVVLRTTRFPVELSADIRRGLKLNGYSLYKKRNHRSYIVKTPDGKLYWPLVKYLKPVKSSGKGAK